MTPLTARQPETLTEAEREALADEWDGYGRGVSSTWRHAATDLRDLLVSGHAMSLAQTVALIYGPSAAPITPVANATEWQPGDPLHTTVGSHSHYLFNFRADPESEHCGPCGDAAVWSPDPSRQVGSFLYMLDESHDLHDFVAECRACPPTLTAGTAKERTTYE